MFYNISGGIFVNDSLNFIQNLNWDISGNICEISTKRTFAFRIFWLKFLKQWIFFINYIVVRIKLIISSFCSKKNLFKIANTRKLVYLLIQYYFLNLPQKKRYLHAKLYVMFDNISKIKSCNIFVIWLL